jgi:pyruvate kinase
MIRQRTKIVCTLGPASSDPRVLRRLIEAGANVFRLNMSHGTLDEHAALIRAIRRAARSLNQPTGILVDRFRPEAPVLALRHAWENACSQTLAWGVEPVVVPLSPKRGIAMIESWLRRNGVKKRRDYLVLLQSTKGRDFAGSDLLRIIHL